MRKSGAPAQRKGPSAPTPPKISSKLASAPVQKGSSKPSPGQNRKHAAGPDMALRRAGAEMNKLNQNTNGGKADPQNKAIKKCVDKVGSLNSEGFG